MSSALELIELRVKQIEDQVLGQRSKWSDTKSADNNLMEQILQIESKLKELTAGKERFNNCFKKTKELDKYLDNEYIDRISSSDSTKFEQIMNFEDQIRSEAKSLERVEELAKHLDSSHIRDLDKLEPKLNKIRLISLEVSQASNRVEDKTRLLVMAYNQWLENIKQQLTDWDQVLTRLEANKNKPKTNRTEVEID